MRVGVVDIGTNSMRLLIRDEDREYGRWVEVTGLGRGVDATGQLSDQAVDRTLDVFDRFENLMTEHDVAERRAMATSATRDASNRDQFLDRAEIALGVRPDVITGEREGALAYAGATAELGAGNWVVSDIGGGSTEFVSALGSVSIDIGSVRLSDRVLKNRPPSPGELDAARDHLTTLFGEVGVAGDVVGVAGTWTSLAAIDLQLERYDRERVHHHQLSSRALDAIVDDLAQRTVSETEAIPSLDPKRAPVILAGAVVARAVMQTAHVEAVLISEHDTLDGLAMELLDVT